METVRAKDSGTLQYDWFMNADETECVVRETYRDSDAVLQHLGNVGDKLMALMGTSDMELEAYGSPSAALLEAVGPMAPRIYGSMQSL